MHQEQETNIKERSRKDIVWEAFLAGFFTTVGTMAAFAAFANRDKIKRVVKYAIQEAR